MSQAAGSKLALIIAPSTPAPKLSVSATPTQTPSPGTWRHPRYDEITRRQKASIFDASNVQRILFNALALLGTWSTGWAGDVIAPIMDILLRPIGEDNASWLVLLLRLTFLYNIYAALRPLYRAEDPMSDIPLTPTQRSLLGLDPRISSSTSSTPGSSPGTSPFITPPRYRRSITPRGGSRSPASNAASPLARKASASSMRQSGGSPSPSTPSALWRKTLAGSRDLSSRRHSYGSPSPLGPGNNDSSVLGLPPTPSPTVAGRGASVALNNKWLYEKGRGSPGRSIFS